MISLSTLQQIHDELFVTTWGLYDLIRDISTPVCHKYGLTLQQLHVLNELRRAPGTTAGVLSDKSGILRTNFAAVCRKLEEKKLITRSSKDGDKRAYALTLSEGGFALLASVENEILLDIQRRSKEVTPDLADQAFHGLQSLQRFIQAMEG